MMCDKAVLDEITSRVCAAAKEVFGGKLEKAGLFGSYAGGGLSRKERYYAQI
jgi:hypothetical protein